MKNKKFKALNDVGIEVEYTILGITAGNKDENYVVYTNFMPSDNELGYRLLVSKIVNEDPFEIKRISMSKQKEIVDSFILEVISTGKKIKYNKKQS